MTFGVMTFATIVFIGALTFFPVALLGPIAEHLAFARQETAEWSIRMSNLLSHLRIVVATLAICVVGYGGLILGIGQGLVPDTADTSLTRLPDGRVVGSRLIGQPFSQVRYFWPRLSAVDYNGAAAGGSNLAPTNPALAERAWPVIQALGATADRPVPADLVTASGSGLDPHISLEAALYQLPRVRDARKMEARKIERLIEHLAFSPGGTFTERRIVNVLELNLALDQMESGAGNTES